MSLQDARQRSARQCDLDGRMDGRRGGRIGRIGRIEGTGRYCLRPAGGRVWPSSLSNEVWHGMLYGVGYVWPARMAFAVVCARMKRSQVIIRA